MSVWSRAREDQLHVVRTSQIKILTEHLLEEDPTVHRSIHNFCEGKLDLTDGGLITIATPLFSLCQRARKIILPFAEDSRIHRALNYWQALHPLGVIAAQDPIGQLLVADALLCELTFEVFMAVETELSPVGEV